MRQLDRSSAEMPSELTITLRRLEHKDIADLPDGATKENNVSLFGSHGENDLEKNLPEILTCRLRRVKRRAIADLPKAQKNQESLTAVASD